MSGPTREQLYWASVEPREYTPVALKDAALLLARTGPFSVEVLVAHIKHLEARLAEVIAPSPGQG